MSLAIDSRIGSKELLRPLERLGLPVEEQTLPFGDLAFTGRGEQGAPIEIGIEFKRLSDLVGSLRSERLQGLQAPGMATLYTFRWLLVEGELLWDAKGLLLHRTGRQSFHPLHGHITIGELHRRLHTLHLQYGLTPWRTNTRRESLKWLEGLYRTWTDKSLDEHRSHIGIYRPPSLAPVSPFVRVVSGLPGIGYELARRLEQRFQTIDYFMRVGKIAWQEVDGVGPKTAQAMHAALTQRSL